MLHSVIKIRISNACESTLTESDCKSDRNKKSSWCACF